MLLAADWHFKCGRHQLLCPNPVAYAWSCCQYQHYQAIKGAVGHTRPTHRYHQCPSLLTGSSSVAGTRCSVTNVQHSQSCKICSSTTKPIQTSCTMPMPCSLPMPCMVCLLSDTDLPCSMLKCMSHTHKLDVRIFPLLLALKSSTSGTSCLQIPANKRLQTSGDCTCRCPMAKLCKGDTCSNYEHANVVCKCRC